MGKAKDDVSLGSYEHFYKSLPAQFDCVPGVVSVRKSPARSLTRYHNDIPHVVTDRKNTSVRPLSVATQSSKTHQVRNCPASERHLIIKDSSKRRVLQQSKSEDSSTAALTSMEDPTVTSHSSPVTMMSNPQAGRSSRGTRSYQVFLPTTEAPPPSYSAAIESALDSDSLVGGNSLSAPYDDSLETGSLPDVLVDHIQVAIRLRPLQTHELTVSKRNLIHRGSTKVKDWRAWTHRDGTISERKSSRHIPSRNVFTFDQVFGEDTQSQAVYEKFGAPIVRAVLTGRNGTLFAYGQTGSGKTHTMQGSSSDEGIIPRAARDLFQQIGHHARVTAQYFEIYNEVIRDLVSDEQSDGILPTLQVHETYTGIEVNGYTHLVTNVQEVLNLLERGQRNRASASTDANAQSSRSHAIFRLKVERRTTKETLTSTLNLVDLAGSENASRSGTTGVRKREGAKINQSLLSLSRVIHSLSLPEKKRPKHIGYRDSKLTRILQPSLEGSACTAILCCASSSRLHFEETRSTFKFAANAKRIAVRPIVNQVPNPESQISTLQHELTETRKALLEMQAQLTLALNTSQNNAPLPVHTPDTPDSARFAQAADESSITQEEVFCSREVSKSQRTHTSAQRLASGQIHIRPLPTSSDDESANLQDSSIVSETRSDAVLFDDSGLSSAFLRQESSRTQMRQASLSASVQSISRSSRGGPPVSEVVILSNSPDRGRGSPEAKFEDAEERASFLAGKLEQTDSLVETLFEDLKQARRQNEDLVSLKTNIESRLQDLEEAKEVKREDNEILMQQHLLLKYAIYVGLAVYLCGWKEYFLAVIVFMWLSLEIVT